MTTAESASNLPSFANAESASHQMVLEQPIVIQDREELLFLLTEAAQLEHMVLCQYLFGAFSLKQSADEGLSAEQLLAVRAWRRTISGVASQEMLHLALVNNLLTAVGGSPCFHHPNFPQRARYFPPEVQHALLPFGDDALTHFLHLECPEGMELPDSPQFANPRPVAPHAAGIEIVPVRQDFATIGHFYRELERGLQTLAARFGEEQIFIGSPEAQATARYFGWPELIQVTNLATAQRAIDTIIKEGEGATGDRVNSHFGRFQQIQDEFRQLKHADSTFEPARPVLAACARQPVDVSEVVLRIQDASTIAVADMFNASYELLLRLLTRFFMHAGETHDEYVTLSTATVDVMSGVIHPLGELLTRLPVGPNHPGKTCGASFEVVTADYLPVERRLAWLVMRERLLELASHAAGLGEPLRGIEQRLQAVANELGKHLGR
jgi:hypothetical protein